MWADVLRYCSPGPYFWSPAWWLDKVCSNQWSSLQRLTQHHRVLVSLWTRVAAAASPLVLTLSVSLGGGRGQWQGEREDGSVRFIHCSAGKCQVTS